MPIRVRKATPSDIPAIVEANCSDVKEWFHWSRSGRGVHADYQELEEWERRMHGGDWMDVNSLRRYWDELGLYGVMPLVAELEGKVVGHLDIIQSREPSFGRFLWLDVLMVHSEYRRRGVATALITSAEEIARKECIPVVMVYPEEYEGPSGLLYRSLDYEMFQKIHNVEVECSDGELSQEIALVNIRLSQEPPLDTHDMICGRWNISQKMWRFGQLQSHVYDPTLHHDIMLAAVARGATYYFRLSKGFSENKAGLTLWSPLKVDGTHSAEVISSVKALASSLGAERMESTVLEKDLEIAAELGLRDKGIGLEPCMRKILTL